MTGEPDPGAKGPGISEMAVAAGALVSGVAALTLTGALGRVQRNEGEDFALAVGLVVVGGAVLLVGGLISPKARRWEPLGRHLGIREVVQTLGVVIALAPGWSSGSGRPSAPRTTRRNPESRSGSTRRR
jgi:ABC-type uncharacterized transport system permease subunit